MTLSPLPGALIQKLLAEARGGEGEGEGEGDDAGGVLRYLDLGGLERLSDRGPRLLEAHTAITLSLLFSNGYKPSIFRYFYRRSARRTARTNSAAL